MTSESRTGFRQNIAVVYSDNTRAKFAEIAGQNGCVYTFWSKGGKINWLMDEYAYLSVNGLSNILRRLGIKHDIIKESIPQDHLRDYDHIFVPGAAYLAEDFIGKLAARVKEGAAVFISGKTNLPDGFLGASNKTVTYLPTRVFEFAGAVLQGHDDIEKLRGILGPSSNFYLEKAALFLRCILERTEFFKLHSVAVRPWGHYDNVLVLRHDTDGSIDGSYLDYEIKNEIPATYAVLSDKNEPIWSRLLRSRPFLEHAYHFRTNREGLLFRILRRLKINIGEADKKACTKNGIIKQFASAQARCDKKFSTLHRHAVYFYYPESIDAMDNTYRHFPGLLGMGTMFRFINCRFGLSYTVKHPDVSVPFWFPFKLGMPTVECFKLLPGWDTASFIEPDPAMTDRVFENAASLPGGVYTFGYHPAHAKGIKFNPDGNFPWFRYSVEKARQNNWWLANSRMVFEKLNDWEDLKLRTSAGNIELYNPTGRVLKNIVLGAGTRIGGIGGDHFERAEMVSDGKIRVPYLDPQEKLSFNIKLNG